MFSKVIFLCAPKISRGSLDTKEKILQGAEDLFMKYGFKSVTMDDVSRELGVSKKTLYQYFEDKNDLVNQCVEQHIRLETESCSMVMDSSKDPIDFMLEISKSFANNQRKVNVGVLFDLKKYFKTAWEKLEQFRTVFILQNIKTNIIAGQEQGLYRNDINHELIARLYVHLVEFMLRPELYAGITINFTELHKELIQYHLRAMCTDKGLKKLNKSLENF